MTKRKQERQLKRSSACSSRILTSSSKAPRTSRSVTSWISPLAPERDDARCS